jgi:hypothetical protein
MTAVPAGTHNLGLEVQFATTSGGVDASKTATFSSTFDSTPPTDSNDREFVYPLPDFGGIDSIT